MFAANFRSMCSIIRQLELGHSRVIIELQFGGTTPMVSDFIESAEPLLVEIKDMLVLTKVSYVWTSFESFFFSLCTVK